MENYEERIERLISEMTLEEKLGQLNQEMTSIERADEVEKRAAEGKIGSCIFAAAAWAGNIEQEDLFIDKVNDIQRAAVEKSRLGIPVINGRDIIHGSRTIFPVPLAQTASWDFDLIKTAASIMSREASYDGVHWTFAPMVDLCVDPRWGRIIEGPGEDPYLGRMLAKAMVEGIQGDDMKKEGHLAACAKHFIGYGGSQGGRDKEPCEWSDYTLRNKVLPAFSEAVDSGVATVMSSFNEVSGEPVTSSKYYLTDVLRGELGFDGFVISDWGTIDNLKKQGVSENNETSAALALNAGLDMDMVDQVYIKNLKSALDKGIVKIETIDEAVRRVLRIKFRLGLFENPYVPTENATDKFMTAEYLEKAREISCHSMVLLKNENALPLKKGADICLAGPYACERAALLGSWHAGGRAEDAITLEEGIKKINPDGKLTVAAGGTEAVYDIINKGDTFVLALGEGSFVTGEFNSLSQIEIEKSQVELAKTLKGRGKKVIAVIFAGRPLAITELLPYCDAVLWAWHGGTMCGLSASEILFGDFNPCGKLPVTFPRSTGQIPIYYNHNRNVFGIYGYYTSANSYLDIESTPAFEFGYGLSYTDFEYSDFECKFENNEIKTRFKLKNCGKYHGFEISQCYIGDPVASMARPVKELKGFKKTFLKAGEEKTVEISIPKSELEFYGRDGKKVFEEGKFIVEIGKSCKNICFNAELYIK